MAFWVYILRCADGRFYTGHTDDLERRFSEHTAGGFCGFTARRRPVELAWTETFPTRVEALATERRIKPWSRAKKEALIAGDWARLSHFAKPPAERPSTSLGTNGVVDQGPYRSQADRPSTSLGPNGNRLAGHDPFVSSEVVTRSPAP